MNLNKNDVRGGKTIMRINKIALIFSLISLLLFQTAAADDLTATIEGGLDSVFRVFIGGSTIANAQTMCRQVQYSTTMARGACVGIPLYLFFFALPGLILYAILVDMLLFMGFVRAWTARTLGFAMALFAARTGAYFKLATELNDLFNNTLVSMISLLFTMMCFWWVLGHILYGFQINREILRQQSAITYLSAVGQTLEARARGG